MTLALMRDLREHRAARAAALTVFLQFLELRHKVELHNLTGRMVECPLDELNRPRASVDPQLRIPPTEAEIEQLFAGWRTEPVTCRKFAPPARNDAAARLAADVGLRIADQRCPHARPGRRPLGAGPVRQAQTSATARAHIGEVPTSRPSSLARLATPSRPARAPAGPCHPGEPPSLPARRQPASRRRPMTCVHCGTPLPPGGRRIGATATTCVERGRRSRGARQSGSSWWTTSTCPTGAPLSPDTPSVSATWPTEPFEPGSTSAAPPGRTPRTGTC